MIIDLSKLMPFLEKIDKIDSLEAKIDTLSEALARQQQRKESKGIAAWTRITDLKPATFYVYRGAGRIPERLFNKVGKSYVFDIPALEAWVRAGKPTPAEEEANRYSR